jgi:hypothetical protein
LRSKPANMPNIGTSFILVQFWGERAIVEIAQGNAASAGILARLATIYAKQITVGLAFRLLNYVAVDSQDAAAILKQRHGL